MIRRDFFFLKTIYNDLIAELRKQSCSCKQTKNEKKINDRFIDLRDKLTTHMRLDESEIRSFQCIRDKVHQPNDIIQKVPFSIAFRFYASEMD